MFFGVIVEEGPAEQLISHPRHPYTFLLLDAIPIPDPEAGPPASHGSYQRAEERVTGEPSAMGCVFSNRCPFVEEKCRTEAPPLVERHRPDHRAACWFPDRVPDLQAARRRALQRARPQRVIAKRHTA